MPEKRLFHFKCVFVNNQNKQIELCGVNIQFTVGKEKRAKK